MAVRFDALGDTVSRTSGLPSVRNFTAIGWCHVVSDIGGSTAQPIFSMLDAGLSDGVLFQWNDSAASQASLVVLDGGVALDFAIFGSRPAVGVPFAWFVRCSGDGTDTVTAGFREATANTWSTLTCDMAGSVAAATTMALADIAALVRLDCRMWNVKIWDRSLNDDELLVESFYAGVKYPTSLHLWWQLKRHDDLSDSSGNGRSGTSGGTLTTEDASWQPWKSGAQIIVRVQGADPATAFQTDAFQSDAFQIYGGSYGAPPASSRGIVFGNRGTAFNGGKTFIGPLH